ncbi:helicase domain protein [Thermosinus carboxydivorans Nor1]|uniref:Helicase domain protein n=1 Tax=Thermosinus carboxydivorans Nor1 TaxID=401526 RepID=A1HQI6_9FIRM|nr:helicase-related protein [Thermosinus carboxydivorans]EAX47791.1 helicase domain protein [Thermosinus carboxydivorans Nor1]
MAIIDDFLKECVEKVDNHDVVVLVGFTKEQTDYIRAYLKPKYNWVDYRGVTTYKKLSEVVNDNLINILFELKQGKKILLSYEELLLLAPQLNFVKDKNYLILKNPLNIVLPLEYSQSLLSDLYSKSIDLSDSDDEEVTAVFQFYNVIPIETKNGLLFHGECRDLGEIISTLQSVEIFPQVIGMEPPIVQRKISEINDSKILVMDLSGQGIFSEHIFQPREIQRFISSICTGVEIFFLNGENWPGIADFAGLLSNYDITVKKLEIPVSKEYQYAKNYKDKVHAVLRKHWGKDATFRIYSMYRNDKRDGSLTEVSQEDIVYEIIEQVYSAKNNEQYQDIFFVASTGAGKSLLYQLPSKIFHDENMVTVVITPLKSLMTDQYQDARIKGLRHVVYINSDVPYAERQVRLEGVKQGTYSLLYISPEFLQRVYDIRQIVGDREIALFVVDEAHCVSSWGKDFRADYGYLGRYIARYKNRDGRFPILALTATAVYGGPLDTIAEISMDLKMQNPIIYMTDVKRKNISINIKKFQFSTGKYDKNKHQIALSRVKQFLEDNRKFIVYSPYKTTSNNLFIDIDAKKREHVRVYTGETTYEEGLAILDDFKRGAVRGVIATKAFGMGVDIRDIEVVYHYAIPANLADYVQEIGRAGRDATVNAEAICDFHPKDFGYWRTDKPLNFGVLS